MQLQDDKWGTGATVGYVRTGVELKARVIQVTLSGNGWWMYGELIERNESEDANHENTQNHKNTGMCMYLYEVGVYNVVGSKDSISNFPMSSSVIHSECAVL